MLQAKAFDKKTSVLHYVVKLVKKNDESLLYFENDLGHVIPAESVLLDAIIGDMKVLQNELTEITKIVTKDADSVEKSGDAPKLTLAELVEQKSIVQHIEEASQKINTNSHLTGRTPMERFSMNAKVACDQADESINSVQAKYALILGYFGEDENMPTGDFFGTLRRFMTEWKKATKQVENIERKKVRVWILLLIKIKIFVSYFQIKIIFSMLNMLLLGKRKEARRKESSESKEVEKIEKFLSEETRWREGGYESPASFRRYCITCR
jgi:hypothetical protein